MAKATANKSCQRESKTVNTNTTPTHLAVWGIRGEGVNGDMVEKWLQVMTSGIVSVLSPSNPSAWLRDFAHLGAVRVTKNGESVYKSGALIASDESNDESNDESDDDAVRAYRPLVGGVAIATLDYEGALVE